MKYRHDGCRAVIRATCYPEPIYNGTVPIGHKCPICGKFFNDEHAARKPSYCEDCGSALKWEV